MAMAQRFKKGDHVAWDTPQGTNTGRVVKKLTEPMEIDGHHVAASPDNPEYLVETEETKKRAAHRPDALRKMGAF